MKHEYKQKTLENLNGISVRIKVIKNMLEGSQPANPEEAKRMAVEIERLLELTTNIVDIA